MMFSTWGFKAISGIRKRAATIEDRSIVISLKRKAKGEKIARLRHAPKADFADVASKLARVAKDQMAAFSLARPDLPEALNDRAQDNWEHLFAIADIAGADWPRKAKQAACPSVEWKPKGPAKTPRSSKISGKPLAIRTRSPVKCWSPFSCDA
jgi:putative DNA primase/helicase